MGAAGLAQRENIAQAEAALSGVRIQLAILAAPGRHALLPCTGPALLQLRGHLPLWRLSLSHSQLSQLAANISPHLVICRKRFG